MTPLYAQPVPELDFVDQIRPVYGGYYWQIQAGGWIICISRNQFSRGHDLGLFELWVESDGSDDEDYIDLPGVSLERVLNFIANFDAETGTERVLEVGDV